MNLVIWLVDIFLSPTYSFSQLPDFLGGSCACSAEGGCLRSNMGPWNDPAIMKVAFCVFTIVSFLESFGPRQTLIVMLTSECWIILHYIDEIDSEQKLFVPSVACA